MRFAREISLKIIPVEPTIKQPQRRCDEKTCFIIATILRKK